ncbi:MAG: GNAT family N-acetyltransferase [Sphingomonadaceae bacterium]
MFARTRRLLLRPGFMEDAPALVRAIADPAIVRNLATAPWPYRLADAERFLAGERGPAEPSLLVLRRASGDPEIVGGIGLSAAPGGGIEIGYWIARPHWDKGYATEAGRALIDIARRGLRLDRLVAGHFLDNPASGRVLEKLGFRPTGRVVRRASLARGGEAPCREFVLDLDGEAEVAAPATLAA